MPYEPKVIFDLHGENYFLDNFYPCSVTYEGLTYRSTEAAFQAAKTLDVADRVRFQYMNAGISKSEGRQLNLRPDWEDVKSKVMEDVLRLKFNKDTYPDLVDRLVATQGYYIIEGNSWHDNCWGYCFCQKCMFLPKENRLGCLLMKIRREYYA